MDIQCGVCDEDFLFFDTEFVKMKCNHLYHQECLPTESTSCPICKPDAGGKKQCPRVAGVEQNAENAVTWKYEEEQLQPVTWDELARLQQDCDRLLAIFAEHIADVAAADRKTDPIAYMKTVTKAVTRIAYPTVLVKKIIQGLHSYREETESLYRRDENNELINFGVPIRYSEETTTTINAVRRCIDELNKCMEVELTRSANLTKWEQELRRMFPNINDDDMILQVADPSSVYSPGSQGSEIEY